MCTLEVLTSKTFQSSFFLKIMSSVNNFPDFFGFLTNREIMIFPGRVTVIPGVVKCTFLTD